MEAIWNKNRRKIDANSERLFFDFLFFFGKTMIFEVRGIPKSMKNRLETHQKLKPLGIDLGWILVGLGGQLGGTIEPRSNKDRSKNALKK